MPELLETAIYAVIPGLVCVIIGGLPMTPIPLPKGILSILVFPETAGVSIALTVAFFPLIQWVRRRMGTHVMAFFSAVTLILVASAGLLAFLTSGWPAGDALTLWIILGSLIVLGQLLFFLAIKGMLISGDLT